MLDIKHDPLFPLGQILITVKAQAQVPPEEVNGALARHGSCDWGEIGSGDWRENDYSLKNECRLHSSYHARNGTRFWVITEADRHVTSVLLPEDY